MTEPLSVTHPDLAKQWHPFKNENCSPDSVTYGSGRRIWWTCEKGHEWQATVHNRSKGNGCPYCANKKVNHTNSLAALKPKFLREWHPTKNGNLTPHQVTPGSEKRVWWMCDKGHEWRVTIYNRVHGYDCPYCAGQKTDGTNSLAVLDVELAKQWHPTKNGTLTPLDVMPGTDRKVWWQCDKGHEWEARIYDRSNGKGCPFCSGHRTDGTNSLAVLNPVLAKEWHPTRNGNLTPRQVMLRSGKKVWWKCEKGHEWEAQIASRSDGRGCPYCVSQLNTSFAEQAILFYVQRICPEAVSRHQLTNGRYSVEVDVFLPSHGIAIEYDGLFWHATKKTQDEFKNRFLQKKNIRLIRIRDKGLPHLEPYGSVVIECEDYKHESIQSAIETLYTTLKGVGVHVPANSVDVKGHEPDIRSLYVQLERSNSLASMYPDVALQWHPTKNGDLKPGHFASRSAYRAWWLCSEGHEWATAIHNRTKNGSGCPYCSRRKRQTPR